MDIYLLRHGIAEDARAGQPDSERALTSEGRDKLRRVMKRAKAAGVELSLILTSPLRRAVETAEIAADVLGYKADLIRTKALIPDAPPPESWEEIRTHKAEQAILLAGHEPHMSAFTAYLLGSPGVMVDMKKAALVHLETDRFGPHPRCVLKWMLTAGLAGD